MEGITVAILIDALGFELCRRYGFRPAALSYSVRLKTVLGYSQAAIASLMTGQNPDRHGSWLMYSFSEHGSPFGWLRFLPGSVSAERLWLRRLMRWNLERLHGVRSYYDLYSVPRSVFPYLDLPARDNIFEPGAGRATHTVLDWLETRGAGVMVWDYRVNESEAFDALESQLKKGKPGFYLLYTAGLDADMHEQGTAGKAVRSHLGWYSERVERIAELASAGGGNTRIFLFGDHGMCDVSRHVDLVSSVEKLGLRIPGDYVPFYDSTMARFRVRSHRAGSRLKDLLAGCPFGSVLEQDEKRRLGVDFPDGRYGDVIFLLNPGSIILPSFMGKEPVAAMHGYHPDAEGMYSVMFTNVESGAADMSICDMACMLAPCFDTGADEGGER